VSGYLVEVKRSARRSNAAVGTVVNSHGVQHRFDSRDAAESWAADLADDDAPVWIRAANPDDRSDVDAYLIGWLRAVKAPAPEETPGEQAWLADFGWNGTDRTERAADRDPRGGEQITDWLASE
jgi:hypothetical protein